jgi:uncharacterized LabA/DUF88 family protein
VSKNVAVFVDVANIFFAAKAAGVDIDYVTLLKTASAGRDLVRAYAYTGLDPENENQRNFHDFLRRHGYRVVSKDIRKYGDGKVKANLDIELVVDMMKTARNLDIAIVVSGDGDFAPAIRAVQEQGVRVEVISFRGNTSSDLIDVADQFTDITQLAKVERDSNRSGRRVADDEHDLSMTEVPDKLTEGSGLSRTRGRGRGRGRTAEGATPSRRGAGVSEPVPAAVAASAADVAESGGGTMVALPGERLSRVVPTTSPAANGSADELEDEGALAAFGPAAEGADSGEADGGDGSAADGGRRRRRRGGRGRGRGRGPGEDAVEPFAPSASGADDRAGQYTPRAGGSTAFGSVWDSQIGTPSQRSMSEPTEDDDFEEPAIPEYLIAERRQRSAGGGRGGRPGRGGRSGAYSSFVERERYGRGGGGGINRYPDVSGRERGGREPLPPRLDRPRSNQGASAEPWSEVPPELEALLRAQLASRPKQSAEAQVTGTSPSDASGSATTASPTGRRRGRGSPPPVGAGMDVPALGQDAAAPAQEEAPPTFGSTSPVRGRRRATASEAAPVDAETATGAARPRRSRSVAGVPAAGTPESGTGEPPTAGSSVPAAPATAARRRTRAASSAEPGSGDTDTAAAGASGGDSPSPVKRRTTARRPGAAASSEQPAKAPRRRTPKAAEAASD